MTHVRSELAGVGSAETVAQVVELLVEWGFLHCEGADGRAPLYRGTAKLEETGSYSLIIVTYRTIGGITILTARSRSSLRDLLGLAIAPFSQGMESPSFPGRFTAHPKPTRERQAQEATPKPVTKTRVEEA